jgi:hypothetical protein
MILVMYNIFQEVHIQSSRIIVFLKKGLPVPTSVSICERIGIDRHTAVKQLADPDAFRCEQSPSCKMDG